MGRSTDDRLEILQRLEDGQIDAEQALHVLGGGSPPEVGDEPGRLKTGRSAWRLIAFAGGLAFLAGGGWLGCIGGWSWLGGAPLLFAGILLLIGCMLEGRFLVWPSRSGGKKHP
jgi:hypothetical protein